MAKETLRKRLAPLPGEGGLRHCFSNFLMPASHPAKPRAITAADEIAMQLVTRTSEMLLAASNDVTMLCEAVAFT